MFSETAMCWICPQLLETEINVDLRLELMQICLVLVEVRYCKLWIPVSRTCFSEHRFRLNRKIFQAKPKINNWNNWKHIS